MVKMHGNQRGKVAVNKVVFEITPWDTLLFRDGLPMNKESSNYIESKAMPFPSVFYGALCTALMERGKLGNVKKKIEDINKERKSLIKNMKQADKVNTLTEIGRLRDELSAEMAQSLNIKGIYLKQNQELYMPAPLDLFVTAEGKVYQGEYKNDEGILEIPMVNKKLGSVQGKYIKVDDYVKYYRDESYSNVDIYSESKFWNRYQKVGIELDQKRVEEGHLYFSNMLETLEGTSFVIEAEMSEEVEPNFETNIFLGGERKMAHLNIYNDKYKDLERLQEDMNSNELYKYVKVIFVTPYMLSNRDGEKKVDTIVNQVVGKLEYVAGYDMALGKQKPMRQALPAGSILVLDSFRRRNFCKFA